MRPTVLLLRKNSLFTTRIGMAFLLMALPMMIFAVTVSDEAPASEEDDNFYRVDHHAIEELEWEEMQDYWECHEIYYVPYHFKRVSRKDWHTYRRIYRSFMGGSLPGITPKRKLDAKAASSLRERSPLRVAPATKLSLERMINHSHHHHKPQPASTLYKDGFEVPIEVRLHRKTGRGVFAREFIAKGSLIWTSQYTAKLESYVDFQRFVLALPNDRLRCDILQWAYVREQTDETTYICVDLDEGALLNTGASHDPNHVKRRVNAKMSRPDDTRIKRCPWYRECQLQFFATVDIQAGAEILLDYDEFAIGTAY